DHVADRGLGGGDLRACGLGLAHDHVVGLFDHFTAGYRHHSCSLLSRLLLCFRTWCLFPLLGAARLTRQRATFGPTTACAPAADPRILSTACRLRLFLPGAIPPPCGCAMIAPEPAGPRGP